MRLSFSIHISSLTGHWYLKNRWRERTKLQPHGCHQRHHLGLWGPLWPFWAFAILVQRDAPAKPDQRKETIAPSTGSSKSSSPGLCNVTCTLVPSSSIPFFFPPHFFPFLFPSVVSHDIHLSVLPFWANQMQLPPFRLAACSLMRVTKRSPGVLVCHVLC